MMRIVSIRCLLLTAGILWGACGAGTRAPAGEMRVDHWRNNQAGAQQFVAVMGEVGRPGVFELTNPLPELTDLVKLAGGKSASASGSVRIMRGGRMMQLFLSPKLHYMMLPNDLVVVESKQFSTARSFADSGTGTGPQRNPDGVSRASEPTIVQLGLVGLIARPVILDVTPAQAQLNQVLSLLRQPSAGPGSITLIKPGTGLQEVPLDEASQTPLSSGTVLVFNPATVNTGTLPRLPNTVRPNADSSVETPSAAEATTSKIPPVEAVPRVPSEAPGERPLLLSQSDSLVPTRALPGSSSVETAQNTIVDPSSHLEDAVAGDHQISDPASATEDVQSPEIDEEPQPAAEKIAAQSPWKISGTTWSVLTALLACCLAPFFWSRRKAPKRRPVVALEPVAATTTESALEKLIAGSMTIVEEGLDLPFESKIFGRPVKRPHLVFDWAHDLGGPHYQKSSVRGNDVRRETVSQHAGYSPVASPDRADQGYAIAGANDENREPVEPAAPAAKSNASIDLPHDRKVRIDRSHPRSDKGVLDRVLSTFEGERS